MAPNRVTGDSRGVSQVVAVVLLVAVVVLAAVVGPVVLGVGQEVPDAGPAPQTQFTWSHDETASPTTPTVEHQGWETVAKGRLRFVASDGGSLSPTWGDPGDGEVTVEDSAEFSGVASDEIILGSWSDPESDSGQLLVRWIGPDADPPAG